VSETVGSEPQFDHYSDHYTAHGVEIFTELRANDPVSRSGNYDGFWILSRYEDVRKTLADHGTFSSAKWQDEEGCWLGGTAIPTNSQPPLLPLEMDPPLATVYRKAMTPYFTAGKAEAMRPRLKDLAGALIDRHIESGRMDVVLDLGNPLPAVVTLELIGLPLDDWESFAAPMHQILYAEPGSELFVEAATGVGRISEALAELVATRRVEPKDDLTSYLCQARVDDAPIPDADVVNVLMTVLGGGVDTSTAALACAIHWLDSHPAERARLIAEPELLPLACEEFLRYFTPAQMIARTALHDTEINGTRIWAGDRVIVPYCSANRDESMFENPHEIVLDRKPVQHIAFGFGVHRCIGSHLGRAEFQTMLGELLRRIPDFSVVADEAERYPKVAFVNGFVKLPVTFTPGSRESAGAVS
jgi:cytochrome P450